MCPRKADKPDKPDWHGLGAWWLDELDNDPAYEDEVTPMLIDLARPSGRVLDVGCGEGRLMRTLVDAGCDPVGVDIAADLLLRASQVAPVVRGRLPSLECFRSAVFDGAVVSLVLEHIGDHNTLFRELARTVRPRGSLALVVNHPIYTAPGSAPIEEPEGEVLWRPGSYLESGHTDEPAGSKSVRFHHRPLGTLLSDAADVGWAVERVIEKGVTASQIERHPPLAKQPHIPRLLGIRWRL